MTAPIRDRIDELADLAPDGTTAATRRERPDIARHAEGAFRALFHPEAAGALPAAERWAAARLSAALAGDERLARSYRLEAQGDSVSPRWDAIARHVTLATLRPADAEAADLDRLREVGLDEAAIVTLSQIVAFVAFELRLLAGLRAMAIADAGHGDGCGEPPPQAAARPQPGHRFTLEPVEWLPWVAPVDPAAATDAQRASLSETPSNLKVTAYSLVLAHDPAALSERTPLFNKIMYAPRGLPRVDRELATLVESVGNGCVFCASVHGRRLLELGGDPATVASLFAGGDGAGGPRSDAIVAFSRALSAAQPCIAGGDVDTLRRFDLDRLAVLDLLHAISMFAWANRLMLTLGEPASNPAGST